MISFLAVHLDLISLVELEGTLEIIAFNLFILSMKIPETQKHDLITNNRQN